MSHRTAVVLLVGLVSAVLSWTAVMALSGRSIQQAGDEVTAQLAGDLQAAFDPATLRPASNPTGAEHLVLRDGLVVGSSTLPLQLRPADLLVDGTPVAVEGYQLRTRVAADAEGVPHVLVALVPLAGQPPRVVLLVGMMVPVLLVAALSSRPGRPAGG